MKKKIAILGSTGSIGKSTLEVINKDKKNFDIILLTANNNFKEINKQIKYLKPKNLVINNKKIYFKLKKKYKKINIFNNFDLFFKKFNKKVDYTISAISGLSGLQPTLDIIKHTKNVAIANKESIICAWNLIEKELKKNKTKFIPVDSEHFSIWYLLKNKKIQTVEQIVITASGGPFLNFSKKRLKKVSPAQAVRHPNWSMGKKISIDSANLMNKVFEVIEACKLFKFDQSKYKIMIHPQSYVHSIIRFKNGLIKMILYSADMKIPISNTIYRSNNNILKNSKIEIERINNLNFQEVNPKIFPSIKLLNKCFSSGLSTPIIINAANEVLVDLFLKRKIEFLDIVKTINRILTGKDFRKYAKRKPSSIKVIKMADNWARLKTVNMCVR